MQVKTEFNQISEDRIKIWLSYQTSNYFIRYIPQLHIGINSLVGQMRIIQLVDLPDTSICES